jgi:hypothetical protein
LPRLADQLANRRHVGPKLQFPRRPALTGQKIQFQPHNFARSRQGNARNQQRP